jgi:hypothetical protein
MNHLREAAQQALEALEKTHTQPGCEQWQAERKASVALRAALAQQEPKPFGYIWPTGRHPEFRYTQLYTAPPRREPEQEPVAWIHRQGNHWDVSERILNDDEKARGWTEEPLYTHPPRREWQSLSEDELTALGVIHSRYQEESLETGGWFDFARAIEAALKKKNNG